VRTLIEIDKLGTPKGYTVLGVAVLDDLTALITIVAGAAFVTTGKFDVITLAKTASLAFLFWIATVVILYRFSNKIMSLAFSMHVEEAMASILLGIFALAAYLTKYFGLSSSYLAMMGGAFLGETWRRTYIIHNRLSSTSITTCSCKGSGFIVTSD